MFRKLTTKVIGDRLPERRNRFIKTNDLKREKRYVNFDIKIINTCYSAKLLKKKTLDIRHSCDVDSGCFYLVCKLLLSPEANSVLILINFFTKLVKLSIFATKRNR